MKLSRTTSSLSLAVACLFLLNCAHHRDVRPGENGIHLVVLQAEGHEGRYREAKSEADHFCEQFKKKPVVLKEDIKYEGDMSEESYRKTKAFSRGAKTVGTIGSVFGSGPVKGVSGATFLAGSGAGAYAGEGYTYSMKFKCVQ